MCAPFSIKAQIRAVQFDDDLTKLQQLVETVLYEIPNFGKSDKLGAVKLNKLLNDLNKAMDT